MNKRAVFVSIYTFLTAFVLLFTPFSAGAYTFTKNLKQGDTGIDVQELQKALNTNTVTKVSAIGPGSPGFETMFFGSATNKAVIAFQELHRDEILIPAGLSKGNGYVGPLTRQKLNTLFSGSSSLQSSSSAATSTSSSASTITTGAGQSLLSGVPVLTHLSMSSFGDGDKIVIYGKNFQSKNTVLISIELPNKYVDIVTASTTSMELLVKNTMSEGLKKEFAKFDSNTHDLVVDKIKTEMNKKNPSTDGNWYFPATLTVRNSIGTSNSLPVNINLLKGV